MAVLGVAGKVRRGGHKQGQGGKQGSRQGMLGSSRDQERRTSRAAAGAGRRGGTGCRWGAGRVKGDRG